MDVNDEDTVVKVSQEQLEKQKEEKVNEGEKEKANSRIRRTKNKFQHMNEDKLRKEKNRHTEYLKKELTEGKY